MPRTKSATADSFVTTVRMSARDGAFFNAWASAHGTTLAGVLRQFAADYRDWFGVPDNLRDALEADAKAMGKDIRDYMVFLLGRRYDELREQREEPKRRGKPGDQ